MTEPPTTEALAELIAHLGKALRSAVSVGNPAPAIAELAARMRQPQPGDLVMETSSWGSFDPDGVGRLLRIEHDEDDPDTGDRFVVEPLHRPGEEQGWQNSSFTALPDQRSSAKWAAS